MITLEDKLKDFKLRLQLLKQETEETTDIICFPEIRITKEQLELISEKLSGLFVDELFDYYRNKIQGEILLSKSAYTTREDQPDFQYIIDLGIKAMSMGIAL